AAGVGSPFPPLVYPYFRHGRLFPTYSLSHRVIKSICRRWQAVRAELNNKEYDGEEAKEWSLNIADNIREGVKTLNVPR
ncbi:unnamed protein product, partial [Sphacelaria rigidula]